MPGTLRQRSAGIVAATFERLLQLCLLRFSSEHRHPTPHPPLDLSRVETLPCLMSDGDKIEPFTRREEVTPVSVQAVVSRAGA